MDRAYLATKVAIINEIDELFVCFIFDKTRICIILNNWIMSF